MNETLNQLTKEELKIYIREAVSEVMEDYIEDILAMTSKDYINSVREAREDYRTGNTHTLDELMNE